MITTFILFVLIGISLYVAFYLYRGYEDEVRSEVMQLRMVQSLRGFSENEEHATETYNFSRQYGSLLAMTHLAFRVCNQYNKEHPLPGKLIDGGDIVGDNSFAYHRKDGMVLKFNFPMPETMEADYRSRYSRWREENRKKLKAENDWRLWLAHNEAKAEVEASADTVDNDSANNEDTPAKPVESMDKTRAKDNDRAVRGDNAGKNTESKKVKPGKNNPEVDMEVPDENVPVADVALSPYRHVIRNPKCFSIVSYPTEEEFRAGFSGDGKQIFAYRFGDDPMEDFRNEDVSSLIFATILVHIENRGADGKLDLSHITPDTRELTKLKSNKDS